MLVYSKKIIRFIANINSILKDVLSKEVGLKVFNDRFYDRRQQYSYPINPVVFNDNSKLAYFDSNFYELGFHECLMNSSTEQLHNIIRHELAHYITWINYENTVMPHGVEFQAFCLSMGWGEEVYRATTCLDNGPCDSTMEESGILRKVQKLMALASSSNTNEAEQAMLKSQQLLLKHNINSTSLLEDNNEKIILKRIMKQKKKSAKMRSIAMILKTFFVNAIYSRGGGFTYLEISGSSVNVEIAEYVANILHHEFEKLWICAKRQHTNLKGTIAKNSFFLGIAQGYCDKINFLKKEHNSDTANALIIIEKKLENASSMVYSRLTANRSSGSYCSDSSKLGEQAGRDLNINQAINSSPKNSEKYLEALT
jgi:Protein of unknown function (DUF2786)/SprT-like family